MKTFTRHERINDVQYLNKYFEEVNKNLNIGDKFRGNVETYSIRYRRIKNKFFFPINYIHLFIDTLFVRIAPKLSFTKKIYFYITKGKGRVLSKAETYGRLYSCGFELLEEEYKEDKVFFTVKKVGEPTFDMNPSYSFLIKLNRIGLNGKTFKVYKLRTMRPYSEYLQEYIYKKNNLKTGGKIKDDFRISPYGKILRKFWIDELPMILNIIKGEMKIVGVRPLSQHFYNLYDLDLQKNRIKNKPGFIPPYYVDLPKTMSEIMESERNYLKLYEKSPIKTDLKYFFIAFKNVLFKGARSN
tara:strand:- start:13500 stop:14396 length:897 start_codon:yes stop_codon:yes gene_type:complete